MTTASSSTSSAAALPLSDLKSGQSATIAGFDDKSPLMMRFRELGILPGVQLTVLRRAPMGDPIQIDVGGSLLSVRKEEARHVQVKLNSNDAA